MMRDGKSFADKYILQTENSLLISTMSFKEVWNMILIFLVALVSCDCARIYFSKCGIGGFSCVQDNGKIRIAYTCPPNENDITFYLWQFRAPVNTESVMIRNCSNLRLSFQCVSDNRPINQLHVINITNLFIVKSTFTHNPVTIIFENIADLEYIPENTFSQIKRRLPLPGCFNPARDFQNLLFKNINIGTVAPKAFNDLKDFYNLTWNKVKVKRLQHLAVEVAFNKSGNFSIRQSYIEVCEHLAFKITGIQAVFVENKFIDIFSGAINGTIGNFVFSMNSVNNLQSYGISILAENVEISYNHFEYLRASAFERISPGLLQNSQRNFGSLKFIYEFNHNFINFMDAASLNPDMQAYDNVATELKFHHNAFFCSCENLGWIFSSIGYGYNTALLGEFYGTIAEEEYKNTCSYTSCDLPLYAAQKLIENGKCIDNDTAEILC
jgi:hypothetical protein